MTDKHTTLAEALHAYIQFRAGKERLPYMLSPSFFANRLRDGVRTFFGVECNGGAMIADHQFPHLFAEWLRSTH
jgi:hypothetical protein